MLFSFLRTLRSISATFAILGFCVPCSPLVSQTVRVMFAAPDSRSRLAGPWVIRDGSAIDAAAIMTGGLVAISRGDPTIIEVFDSAGARIFLLPNPIDGFRPVPRAGVSELSSNRLIVIDPRRAKLGVYKAQAGVARLETQLEVGHSLSDVCSMNEQAMVFSPVGAGRIDRLSRSGTFQPFVTDVGEARPGVQQSLNESRLLCLPDREEVLVVGTLIPKIRAFDRSGRLRWTATLPNFRTVEAVTSNPREITYRTPEMGYHKVLRVLRLTADIIAIQIVTAGLSTMSWGDPGVIETRFIDLDSHVEVDRSTALPEILATKNGVAVLVDYPKREITRNTYRVLQGSR